MNIFNKLALGAVALAGTATIGAGAIQAAGPKGIGFKPMTNLVNAIATKFNLNPTDVQKVIDDQRTQMEVERHTQQAADQKTRLDQAVKDGKITQAQEDLIIAKQTEIQTFMDSLKDKTEADRQAAIKTEMDAVQAWAKTNNIPDGMLMIGRGGAFGGPRGEGMGKGAGMMGNPRAKLDQAVKDGKITQAQEDLIIAKQAEVKAFRDGLKDKTGADRQAAMKTETQSIKDWATANNIPEQYVIFAGRGRGMGDGGMMHKGKGGWATPSGQDTESN
jgi:uncharacterized membrane protein YwzB